MDLISPKNIKELLSEHGIRPSKALGQNFLISKIVLEKIIGAAHLSHDDIIVEIGPGIGTLTQELAPKVKKVIAVEKDRNMANILAEMLKDHHNIEFIAKDILKVPEAQLPNSSYKIVANIPYYITAPLIRKFLEAKNQPDIMVLMVQKEVAQRICASPPHQSFKKTFGVGAGLHRMSLLAVAVQFYADARIIFPVPRNCFWPKPNVDSAIIKIDPHKKTDRIDSNLFFKVVKAGFSHPRKQLANNLSQALKKDKGQIRQWLLENEIDPGKRAEGLSIENWLKLTGTFPL